MLSDIIKCNDHITAKQMLHIMLEKKQKQCKQKQKQKQKQCLEKPAPKAKVPTMQ